MQRSLRLSVREGLAFALMVGFGEIYFLADAIRLSATRLEQGLIVALPLFVGSIGPLVSLLLLARLPARKPLVVGAAACQALVLFTMAALDGTGLSTPVTLIVGACAYNVFGQAVGTAWSSWFGDLVPTDVRGTYFARRNRWVYFATSAGLFAGGAVLQWVEPASAGVLAGEGGLGFATVFAIAGTARSISTVLHALTPEPTFHGTASRKRVERFLFTPRGIGLRRLLLVCAALQFAVYIAGPYFKPYMLEELAFSYIEYSIASLVVIAAKVALLPSWGRIVDQVGPRGVFLLCALCAALVPLPYLWAQGLGWILVAQAFSGMSWAGYDLSLFCLLIQSTGRGVRAQVFALQGVLNGLAQLAGGLAGALIVGWSADLKTVFAVSLAGRAVVALALPGRIRGLVRDAHVRRRDVLFRVIGFRPNGGLITRPMGVARAPHSDVVAEGTRGGRRREPRAQSPTPTLIPP